MFRRHIEDLMPEIVCWCFRGDLWISFGETSQEGDIHERKDIFHKSVLLEVLIVGGS